MKCIQMTKVDDSKILTQSVMKFLTKQVAKEFDNAEACVTKVRKKSIDTVDVWQLIKANDSTYHIVYILLGYNISKCEMTEEAILNSPKITNPDNSGLLKAAEQIATNVDIANVFVIPIPCIS